ncbi:family 4 glycosyl hydrolase [Candidatus Halobonum tyrrellensis]|uniref:Hydrolytic enzyme lplD n=1 Tax=Candidatus Halobonum tyrrellensis G22 TaxID=1324957 RepID=V4H8F3_9EURY|nr:hydrolytic enzyme lplD [Candidatus Halobonum tyrrellensis]ESP86975.1 hydrolytic enzyme lplD [Candidatus Halobonum tyrrellensis G22]
MYQLTEHEQEREPTGRTRTVKLGYVGGGSQGWAHTLINDLAQCPDLAGEVALYDVDHDAAARNAELGNQVTDRDEAVGDWTFEAYEEMGDALEGADFVVCSTQDPPEETFAHDIDLPEEYGIYQPVADTVGPGGAVRALRAIPQYRDIAATVRERCPDAWVINYTNPMTVCTRALYEEYPDINAIGLCHEVFKTQELFAEMAERYVDGADDVSRDDVEVQVKGINHFTFVDEAHWRDHDLFEYLDEELERRKPLPGFEPGDMDGESYWVNNQQIAFDFYDRFGLLGAAGDRHLAEFVPWYLDIDEPEEVQRWGIRLTPSSARVGDDEGPDEMEEYLSGDEEFEFHDSGEEAVDIMRALLGEEPFVTHLNYPNEGQVANLPEGAVVETNAMLTGSGVTPLSAGDLPEQVRTLVDRHVTNQETLIEAGFTGDLDLAFQAFLAEPLVTIQRDEARELFAELVETERDYFGDYDLDANVLQG